MIGAIANYHEESQFAETTPEDTLKQQKILLDPFS